MREAPLIFNGESVRAILAGRKTQTRRLCPKQPEGYHYLQPMHGTSPDGFAFGDPYLWCEVGPDYPDGPEDEFNCRWAVGDHIWVKEKWFPASAGSSRVLYAADTDYEVLPPGKRWRAPMFMPRVASRLRLVVIAVRAERLQDVTEDDAHAEGMDPFTRPNISTFAAKWDLLNGNKAAWSANPWVWVIEFRFRGGSEVTNV
jgi:hypothetical protein